MNADDFNYLLQDQIKRTSDVLVVKAAEYATSDRLHNFKKAANLTGETSIQALGGFMVKHTVSIYDMIEGSSEEQGYSVDLWDEKITDHINYLILLRALVYENADRSKTQIEHSPLPSYLQPNEVTPNA